MKKHTDDIIQQLEKACESQTPEIVELPSGGRVIVQTAQGLDRLGEALRDPEFSAALKRATHQYKTGQGQPFDPTSVLPRKEK